MGANVRENIISKEIKKEKKRQRKVSMHRQK
jgi:hypothetical protein